MTRKETRDYVAKHNPPVPEIDPPGRAWYVYAIPLCGSPGYRVAGPFNIRKEVLVELSRLIRENDASMNYVARNY